MTIVESIIWHSAAHGGIARRYNAAAILSSSRRRRECDNVAAYRQQLAAGARSNNGRGSVIDRKRAMQRGSAEKSCMWLEEARLGIILKLARVMTSC